MKASGLNVFPAEYSSTVCLRDGGLQAKADVRSSHRDAPWDSSSEMGFEMSGVVMRTWKTVAMLVMMWAVVPVTTSRVLGQTGSCGDGICETDPCPPGGEISPGNGCQEDQYNCPCDCGGTGACWTQPETVSTYFSFIQWPSDGVNWQAFYNNYPEDDKVGGCDGNCGPGCNKWDICGAPDNSGYWNWTPWSGPIYSQYDGEGCLGNDLVQATWISYQEPGVWTYYGWVADGCKQHDWTCRWPQVLFSFALCYTGTSFLAGGACLDAGSETWAYSTTLQWSEATNVQVVTVGACYSGTAKCGDGICETEGCYIGGGPTPGNGCQEDTSSCPQDCGG
jgi:hypothetical protein